MSLTADRGEARNSALSARRAKWIKVTARMGVWGMILATWPALADVIGIPIRPDLTGPIGAAGLLTSGVGVMVASLLVLRALPAGFGSLKLAAIAGIPFGLALISGGAAVLRPLGVFADAIDAAGPLVLVIGVVLVGLLIVGFLQGLARTDSD